MGADQRHAEQLLHRKVYARGLNEWINERVGYSGDATVHASREDAISAAEKMLRYAGGGVLTVRELGSEVEISSRVPSVVASSPNPSGGAGVYQSGSRSGKSASSRNAMSDPVSDTKPESVLINKRSSQRKNKG